MTQNIQGLNTLSKQDQILQTMSINNIDILGLAETNLTDRIAKQIYKKNQHYIAYFHNKTEHPRGSGVGLIFSSKYARNIHKVQGYKGRSIHADSYFTGNTKVRIIQLYLHANFNDSNKEAIKDIHTQLRNIIEEAQRNNFKLIVMGDFNVDPLKYKQSYHTHGTYHWKYQVLYDLEIKNLVDTVELYQNITVQHPFSTYIPNRQHCSPSRIDLIWISRDLVLETLNSNNYEPDLYNTDHNAFFVSFLTNGLLGNKQAAKLRQHKIRKRIFNYDTMDNEKWEKYRAATESIVDDKFSQEMIINEQKNLTTYWNDIVYALKQVAIRTIDNHLVPSNNKEFRPKVLTDAFAEIKYINKLLHLLSTKNFQRNSIFMIQDIWVKKKPKLETITEKHNTPINIPTYIDNTNIVSLKKELKDLHKILQKKYDLINKAHTDKEIKKFVQQRCEDYKSDQGHMIDSFLEKPHRKIVIDRLMHNENGIDTLVTDPSEIKKLTNKHFQTCAGGANEEKQIPDNWKHQYKPQSYIDEKIYDNLMSPPSYDEWTQVIHNLPHNKAAGPSQITNEMLQKMDDKL